VSEPNNVDDALVAISKVLIWCFVFSFVLMLVWFVLFVLPGNIVYRVHSLFFEISEPQLEIVHYCGMALMKMVSFWLFLFPYVAIRLVLRSRRK